MVDLLDQKRERIFTTRLFDRRHYVNATRLSAGEMLAKKIGGVENVTCRNKVRTKNSVFVNKQC